MFSNPVVSPKDKLKIITKIFQEKSDTYTTPEIVDTSQENMLQETGK